MSEVVKHDNPYSRLMALKKMGIVENYAVIHLFILKVNKGKKRSDCRCRRYRISSIINVNPMWSWKTYPL